MDDETYEDVMGIVLGMVFFYAFVVLPASMFVMLMILVTQ